ncbi:MAG: 2-oxoacid:ferredoxin oxidoreductase subunit beta [candidate division Zixibacteria bacterium]|nr:2-oxoacid:ferredoxin oxidoreductase subunit beta [candidate division Zixibacteria bacterium]NIR67841.1 2-oxoacid:ferredoxin oxidoreductase subunit beta [candidate division Zixibacteria bacterium]NIS15537.1 2-oxoacid:ferredoxin oxidoreductase subunit beta [candidate division Zixibacteria bacterium]NIS49067.1 2-oxoacid:ferredoxin oxidoreductase subunit beta [candidate division Zixibacteria bacterium]NIT52062.1 2-oxoacid:ferredoxin oxidoreductase subunit beta [candidate division Zixibacteria ba
MATTTKKQEQPSGVVHKYLRPKKTFPHVWCSGCGIGIILGALIRAIDRLGIPKDDIAVLSGIGCSSRLPVYVDFNTLHTTHGRAIAFATGVKAAKPKMHVIVITGDGDCLAIGGNHFIHACRRNINITTILVNNHIYGMTGGQFSPTTPYTKRGSTAPYGNLEHPFDAAKLAIAAGASYVARGTVYHVGQLTRLIADGISNNGFSLIDALSNCHTYYGRWNKEGDPVKMIEWFKSHVVPAATVDKMPPEKKEGKWITGVLHKEDKPEFTDNYARLSAELKKR